MKNLTADKDVSQIDILTVIEHTGVTVVKQGHYLQTLCPFHNDKDTPSLTIYPETNTFHCFGCKATGNVITWAMLRLNLNYKQAVDWLSENFLYAKKIILPQLPKQNKPKKINPELVLYWHGMLLNSKMDYFQKRGFTENTINTQMLGYDGERMVIPVWEGQPQYSECLGVRLRKLNGEGPKYRGLKNHNTPTVYNRYYCVGKKTILGFAGELDSLRAVQDGFPAFSLVNGMNSFNQFPGDWPELWFSGVENLIVIFDRKEEHVASKVARSWNKIKGARTATVFQWPILEGGPKDYCDFRDKGFETAYLRELIYDQISVRI